MPTSPEDAPADEPPSADQLPVGDDEELMRRFLEGRKNYDRRKEPPLQAGTYLPSKRDGDGLSLNRRVSAARPSFLTPSQLKTWHEVPENIRETCGVVGVMAAAVREVGLTVEPDPASTPGHVLIRQLNWDDFAGSRETNESRDAILYWALRLAQVARVLIPPGKAA
jgi:hypothetical protein